MLLNLETKNMAKKKSKQTKPPEYCKEKEISLILESLEKSHLSYFMYTVLVERKIVIIDPNTWKFVYLHTYLPIFFLNA